MAFTLTQLAALEEAIGTGELSVQYDGKKVEYRSIEELIRAYHFVRNALMATGQVPQINSASLAVFSRN